MSAWEQFWDAVSVLDVVLVIVGVSLVIGFIAKGWPKIHAGIRLIDALGSLPDRLDRIDGRLDDIHHETHKNDGSSIKDAVDRIGKEQSRQADMLASLLVSDDQITVVVDDLTTRLDGYEDTLTEGTP